MVKQRKEIRQHLVTTNGTTAIIRMRIMEPEVGKIATTELGKINMLDASIAIQPTPAANFLYALLGGRRISMHTNSFGGPLMGNGDFVEFWITRKSFAIKDIDATAEKTIFDIANMLYTLEKMNEMPEIKSLINVATRLRRINAIPTEDDTYAQWKNNVRVIFLKTINNAFSRAELQQEFAPLIQLIQKAKPIHHLAGECKTIGSDMIELVLHILEKKGFRPVTAEREDQYGKEVSRHTKTLFPKSAGRSLGIIEIERTKDSRMRWELIQPGALGLILLKEPEKFIGFDEGHTFLGIDPNVDSEGNSQIVATEKWISRMEERMTKIACELESIRTCAEMKTPLSAAHLLWALNPNDNAKKKWTEILTELRRQVAIGNGIMNNREFPYDLIGQRRVE
ncbi:hypothetical protein KKF81_00165 [Candidatus Micrarchaeota archaeon]|nr:hypothetical protein [Candidatus Micrarchaeota archaeon]MBU1165331.1 hypothetical protein [Candidatus Micrarchaeota archaeon]MBU1886981.1 hypothetical protein [Candidatus Micrarchaeota archaeon]